MRVCVAHRLSFIPFFLIFIFSPLKMQRKNLDATLIFKCAKMIVFACVFRSLFSFSYAACQAILFILFFISYVFHFVFNSPTLLICCSILNASNKNDDDRRMFGSTIHLENGKKLKSFSPFIFILFSVIFWQTKIILWCRIQL